MHGAASGYELTPQAWDLGVALVALHTSSDARIITYAPSKVILIGAMMQLITQPMLGILPQKGTQLLASLNGGAAE